MFNGKSKKKNKELHAQVFSLGFGEKGFDLT